MIAVASSSPLHSNSHLQRSSVSLTYTTATLTCAHPFISLLQKCSNTLQLQQIHSLMLKTGAFHNDPLLFTRLLFASCSFSDDPFSRRYALQILSLSPFRNTIVYNSAIRGFSLGSMPEECLLLYLEMLEEETFFPDLYSFPSLLKACSRISAFSEGTQLHGCAVKVEAVADPCVQNALIGMYSACGMIGDARLAFDKMPERTCVSWNCMIASYAEIGCWEDMKSLFWLMVEQSSLAPSSITLVRMITACTRSGDFNSGKRVHRYIEENHVVLSVHLGNALMNMYARFGEMETAHKLFDEMPESDVVSWTTLVSGYAGVGCLEHSRKLFGKMPNRNVVTWNAMIAGYILNGCFKEAAFLFGEMLALDVKPDKASIVSMLSACVQLGDLRMGRTLHAYVEKVRTNFPLELVNSLIEMYSKCGSMDPAEALFKRMEVKNEISWTLMVVGYVKCGEKEVALEIFNKMPHKDGVSWNALTSALAHCNYFSEALSLFHEMQRAEVSSNDLTLVSLLSACGRVGALELGKWIHAYVDRNNIVMDAHLASSLIDMYAKCGCIELSLEVFDDMPKKDVLTWTMMIQGLAMHGHGKHALNLFNQMMQEGVQPDGITFIGVLSACSHGGFVDEGRHYFNLMTQVYGISPKTEHYSCMVDLFGRCGLLSEVEDFMKNIPTNSNGEAIWGALLGACRIHGNVELAEYAMNHLLELDPSNSGAYVLLSNVYAKASQWADVVKVRNMMKGNGIQKMPGCSLIEVNGTVHEFFAGDISHPQSKEICLLLDEMEQQLESSNHLQEFDICTGYI
ncbi:pentatricopeptide repeat-containing protein At3g22690-like [Magnolia sinica]|uniref:pentatricopeptide repeat-containing protein At3g22690-like n=1 Tax=Magnolia sinica TaxID=86752 RepID=UPI00265B6DA0|nr:pentatricopeptide repeat-containing protein At3g22690-like [Magnolia sinica]